jgi:hypothetical protein
MQPTGLTVKDVRTNYFTGRVSGELMVVHVCLNCGKISCNRIAGDDNSYMLAKLVEEKTTINASLSAKLKSLGVNLLSWEDRSLILTAIYGNDYEKYVK